MANAFTIPKESSIGRRLQIEAGKVRKDPKENQPLVLSNSYKNRPPKMMERRK